MSFSIIKQLQYCTGSDYGDNLNKVPSRIIPTSLVEDISQDTDEKSIIYYVPPRLGNEYIICQSGKKLPDPSSYFRSPNTFLKSFLYLVNVNYYDNVHLPFKANSLLEKYIKTLFRQYSQEKTKIVEKKLIQTLINYNGEFDTDPDKNPYFDKFLKIILNKEQCEIVIIRADYKGNYYDMVPEKDLINSKKKHYILLQHANGLFSPYGKLHK